MALSLFAKKQPVADPIPDRGGKYILRQAISLRIRKKENLQSLAQIINAPQDKILAFVRAKTISTRHSSALWQCMCLAMRHIQHRWTDWFRQPNQRRAWAFLLRPIPPAALTFIHHPRRHGQRSPSRRQRQGWSRRVSISGLGDGVTTWQSETPPLPRLVALLTLMRLGAANS